MTCRSGRLLLTPAPFLVAVCAMFCIPAVSWASTKTQYIFLPFDAPSSLGYSTLMSGINDSGEIVASFVSYDYGESGLIYDKGAFDVLDQTQPSLPFSTIAGVNAEGTIVGVAYSDLVPEPFEVTADGTVSMLPTITPKVIPTPTGISNNGEVVGYYEEYNSYHAFLYKNGVYYSYDSPKGYATMFSGISNNGKLIAGTYTAANGRSDSFVLTSTGIASIAVPGGEGTVATGINNSGEVVGYYYTANGIGGFSLIGTTYNKVDFPGNFVTAAYGVNNQGLIVGNSGGAFVAVPKT